MSVQRLPFIAFTSNSLKVEPTAGAKKFKKKIFTIKYLIISIIFPSEKPKVWSLGASINQLGESHHILQEVKNAQHIVNAFDKLWEELSSEECLIWKIK